ncbi:MAG: type II secretion system protein [Acetobacterium sp.]
MKFINKMRKKTKGFTLVEIIVVLVILAILAAFTIPTMLGFVNDAKGKALIAEAREVYVAAQATATEFKATGQTIGGKQMDSNYVVASNSTTWPAAYQMKNYLGTDITAADVALESPPTLANGNSAGSNSAWSIILDTGYKVTQVVYVKNGYAITITEPTTGSATTTVTKL